jgi:TatA/E family protein of Tat protein translocase
MFGTLGTQEIVFIFILALLLFGPKKLPEIGRTVGKALTEFRRASNDLKATFDREMRSLEAETKSLDVTNQYQHDTYNYDYSSYDSSYEGSYGSESPDSHASSITTESASATQDAESPSAAAPEGTVALGTELAAAEGSHGAIPEHPETAEHTDRTPAEHNA